MEQLHVLDGDPPEDDLAPSLLGASHYLELGDYLGLLESIALVAYQVDRVSSTALLRPQEALALAQIEAFHLNELRLMHEALASSELAMSAFFLDMSGVLACCHAAQLRQRRCLLEILSSLGSHPGWTLSGECAKVCQSGHTLFQAAAVFVAWLHQRFQLHYMARDPTDNLIPAPANNELLRPYMLRAISLPPQPQVRRTRLAGWRCDRAAGSDVCATLLAVPALRSPQNMLTAIGDAIAKRSGPFIKKPAAPKGVVVTELVIELNAHR